MQYRIKRYAGEFQTRSTRDASSAQGVGSLPKKDSCTQWPRVHTNAFYWL